MSADPVVVELVAGDILRFQASELLQLYVAGQWDQLSTRFLSHWQYLEDVTWTSVSDEQQYAIDTFVKHFLYLFTQPEYRLKDDDILPFIRHNTVISNVVAMSSTQTTDPWIKILLNQPHNLVKLLTLYSARNKTRLKQSVLFDADPKLVSLWYCHFITAYSSALVSQNSYDHLREHLERADIGAGLHYPVPLHLQPCFAYLGYKEGAFPRAEASSKRILSLPMFPELTGTQVEYVAESILNFYEKGQD